MGNGIKHECSINITHMNQTWVGDWGAMRDARSREKRMSGNKRRRRSRRKKGKALKQSLDSIVGYKLFEPNFPVGFYSHSEAETNR